MVMNPLHFQVRMGPLQTLLTYSVQREVAAVRLDEVETELVQLSKKGTMFDWLVAIGSGLSLGASMG